MKDAEHVSARVLLETLIQAGLKAGPERILANPQHGLLAFGHAVLRYHCPERELPGKLSENASDVRPFAAATLGMGHCVP